MGIFDGFKKKKPRSPHERREQSNEKIKAMGIARNEALPVIEGSDEITLKSLDDICGRAVASLLMAQLACDVAQENDYEQSKAVVTGLLEKFGVQDCLLAEERRLLEGRYSMQTAIDVVWKYEAYWALAWALGLVEDISEPFDTCDCARAIAFVMESGDLDGFKGRCKLRDAEEILDALDLYYRYHWACVDKRLRPDVSIGQLNPEVVVERRRGLEWLVSPETDWNDISLDT